MKTKTLFYILSIVIILFSLHGVNATVISGFTKTVTYNTTNSPSTPSSNDNFLLDNGTNILNIITGVVPINKTYDYNMNFIGYINTSGQSIYGANNLLYVQFATYSVQAKNYNNGVIYSFTFPADTNLMYSFLAQKPMLEYNNIIPFVTSSVSPHLYLLNSTLGGGCSIGLSSGYGHGYKLMGFDNIYIYVWLVSTSQPPKALVYDYSCSLVADNSNLSYTSSIDFTNTINNPNNVVYEPNNMVFYMTTEQHVASFDNEGDRIDSKSLDRITGKPTSLRDYTTKGQCAYSYRYSEYDCIVNDSSNYAYLVRIPTSIYGTFGSVTYTNLSSQKFNGGLATYGSDLYLPNNTFIFNINNELKIIAYNSISNVKEVYSVNHGSIETSTNCTGVQYNGLSCYYDTQCECYNTSSVCFPNNELYTGINDSNYDCYNTIVDSYGGFYCGSELNYCAGGCTNNEYVNNYSVHYLSGDCVNVNIHCTNDCYVEGDVYSDTSTSYKECGFYISSSCLNWGLSIPCAEGQISTNGVCTSLNTSGYTYYNNDIFKVQADLIKDIDTYSLTTNPPESSYKTSNVYELIGFDYIFNPLWTYINKNCDYTETSIITDGNEYIINNTQNKSFDVNAYTNGITTVKFVIPNSGSLKVDLQNTLSQDLFAYTVSYNTSLGAFCLYDNSSSLLGCEVMSYSDMLNLELSIQTIRPNTNQLFSGKLRINKVTGGYQDIYRGFSNALITPSSNYAHLLITSNNATVISTTVFNGEQYLNTWKNTTITQLMSGGKINYQHTCIYSSVGCHVVRSYYATNLNMGLWDYQDWKVCINSLSGASIGNNGIENNLTPMTKMLLGLGIPFGLFVLLVIIGFVVSQKTDNENMVKTFMYIGIFFAIGFLIFFGLKGWIPAWIIIIMFLASAFVIVMLIRGMFAGRGQM